MKIINIEKQSYNEFKLGIFCYKCNYKYNTKIDYISTQFPYNITKIIADISVCDFICPTCEHKFSIDNLYKVVLFDEQYTISYVSNKSYLQVSYPQYKFHVNLNNNSNEITLFDILLTDEKCLLKKRKYDVIDVYIKWVIQGWIKSFKELDDYFRKQITSNINIETNIKNQSNDKKNKIDIEYISDYDNKCTRCNGKIWTVYHQAKKIRYLQCMCCMRIMSVSVTDFNDHYKCVDLLNGNYTDDDFSKKQQHISKKDVLIVTNIQRCTNNEHKMEDVIAELPIMYNGKAETQYIDICYCNNCNVYFILESEFENIHGTPLCIVKYHHVNYSDLHESSYWDINVQHSILYNCGYNVQKNNKLTSDMRKKILINVISEGKLTKNQVRSYLETFIKRNMDRDDRKDAVLKWQDDLEFIKNIKLCDLKRIEINSIKKR